MIHNNEEEEDVEDSHDKYDDDDDDDGDDDDDDEVMDNKRIMILMKMVMASMIMTDLGNKLLDNNHMTSDHCRHNTRTASIWILKIFALKFWERCYKVKMNDEYQNK